MTMTWSAEVYPASGFAVFLAPKYGVFPAELDEGAFDNRFHELWLGLVEGEVAPDWGFQRLVEHRNEPAAGRFIRFCQPDGGVFTFRFRREVPDERLDLWLSERLSEYVPPIDLPTRPEPAAIAPEPKETDDANELGDPRPVPASGGHPEGPEWVWKPENRPQDPPGLPGGQQKRGRGRPRKHPRVDA